MDSFIGRQQSSCPGLVMDSEKHAGSLYFMEMIFEGSMRIRFVSAEIIVFIALFLI